MFRSTIGCVRGIGVFPISSAAPIKGTWKADGRSERVSSAGIVLAVACTVASGTVTLAQSHSDPCESSAPSVEIVSLDRATELALAGDRRSDLAQALIEAARTERAIAGLRPADSIQLDVEDFPGIGLGSDVDNLQVTSRLYRVWERGGKLEARRNVADSAVAVAETALAGARYEIREEVETLYIEIVLAEQRVRLACDRVTVARELESVITKRVDAARDPLLAGARASTARLQAEADARHHAARRSNLEAALGGYLGLVMRVRTEPGFLERLISPHSIDPSSTKPIGLYSPDLKRLEAKRLEAAARTELEARNAVPNLTWNLGVRKFGIEDDLAVVGGVSVLLGSAGRSKAAVDKTEAERRRIETETVVLRQQLERRANVYRRNSVTALDEIQEIETELLPAAARAAALAADGYDRGAFSYLDVIDAQRTLAILREERLDHLRVHLLNQAALARLTTTHNQSIATEEPEE